MREHASERLALLLPPRELGVEPRRRVDDIPEPKPVLLVIAYLVLGYPLAVVLTFHRGSRSEIDPPLLRRDPPHGVRARIGERRVGGKPPHRRHALELVHRLDDAERRERRDFG